jgi:cytoskeletal protein RodZ
MLENNFEKNVKQKLDELSLTPSEPVWLNVEAAIQKKRKRRLAFLLLPVLLMAGGALWWMTLQQPETQTRSKTTEDVETNTTFSKPHATQPDGTPAEKQAAETPPDLKQKEQTTATGDRVLTKNKPQTTTIIATNNNKQKGVHFQNTQSRTSAGKDREKDNRITTPPEEPGTASTFVENHPNPVSGFSDTTVQTSPVEDTTQVKTAPRTDSVENAAPQQPQNLQAKRKLQWHVVSRIGGSNTVAPVAAGLGMKSLQENSGLSQYDNGSAYFPGPGANSSNSLQPAAPVKGLYFSLGATAMVPVGKSSFFKAGLQYSYYSNRISVGERLPADSVLTFLNSSPGILYGDAAEVRQVFSGLSRSSRNNHFANAFHFIELPLGFEYRLLKKVPLQLQHGITISRLVGSNALQYDDRTNVYYQSKSTLRKSGVALFTSMTYRIWSGKSALLQAGPHVQYGLNSFYTSGPDRHLLSGGVVVSMGF